MTALTLADNLDGVEVVVAEDERGQVTGSRYRLYVGRLVVAEEDVPIPSTSHFRASLMVLRAALRSLPEPTTRPISIAVHNHTVAQFLRDPDRLRPESTASAGLLREVSELLLERAPNARILHRLPSTRPRLPPLATRAIVAPAIVTAHGERLAGYVLYSGGLTQSALMRTRPDWGDLEILVTVVAAVKGLDRGSSIIVWSNDSGLHQLLDQGHPPAITTVGAAVRVRHLEANYRLICVRGSYRDLLIAHDRADRWATGAAPTNPATPA